MFLLFACPYSSLAGSSPPLVLGDSQASFSSVDNIETLEDPSRELSLAEVSSPSWDSRFTVNNESNFGRSRSAFWIRFQVTDRSQQKWYLLLEAMLADELDLYVFPVGQAGKSSKSMTEHYASLLKDHRRRAWSLKLPKEETLQVYMRVTNGDAIIIVPVEFLNSDAMLNRSTGAYKISSAIYAGMLVLALHQFFMFVLLRERNYFFLALCMVTAALIHQRINPAFGGFSIFRDTSSYFFSAPLLLAGLSTAAFARDMLETKKNAPRIDFIFKLFIGITLGMMFVVGLLPGGPMYALLLGLIIMSFTVTSGFYVAYFKKGNIVAKYFAWIYLLPAALHVPNLILLALDVKGWQAERDLIPAFGTLLFMVLLSLLQAKRVILVRGAMLRVAAANKAKDEFITVMNHELRTPMNAVVGLSDLLKLENLTPTQHKYAHQLSNAARHIMQLIDNILDYSKAGQAQFKLMHKPFRLDMALQSVYELLLQPANQKGLQLSLDNKTEKTLVIIGDRPRLAQVLVNLLNNSIKYTPDGRVSLRVTRKASDIPDKIKLHFSIRDTGPGISPEQQVKIFEPFTQLTTKTSASKSEGIGLGLPISKQLVEHMGGSLQVNSQPGMGSEFFFEVDVAQGSVIDDEVTELSDQIEEPQCCFPEGLHVLLVDDVELNRFVAAEMLKSMGAEVSQADGGKNTLLQLQRHSYDLVLLDVSMDDIDGLEVARRVRKQYKLKLPIIALTAHATPDMKQQCLEAGMNDFVSKPFRYEELYEAITRQMSKVT